jgi:hypothetical protein
MIDSPKLTESQSSLRAIVWVIKKIAEFVQLENFVNPIFGVLACNGVIKSGYWHSWVSLFGGLAACA